MTMYAIIKLEVKKKNKESVKMAKFEKIENYALINKVIPGKVLQIKKSILKNGWVGMPILFTESGLVTGSHRLTALKELVSEYDKGYLNEEEEQIIEEILENDICEDVTELVDDEIEYDNLSKTFTGTWVEDFKNELEW